MTLTNGVPAATGNANQSSTAAAGSASAGEGNDFTSLIAGLLDDGPATGAGAPGGDAGAGAAVLPDEATIDHATSSGGQPGVLDLAAWLTGLPTAATPPLAATAATDTAPRTGAGTAGLAEAAPGTAGPGGMAISTEVGVRPPGLRAQATGTTAGADAAAGHGAGAAALPAPVPADARTADGSSTGAGSGSGTAPGDASASAETGARGPADFTTLVGAFQRAQGSAASNPTTTAQAAQALQQPVGSPAWADELGTRLTVLATQGQYTASLHLSPEHLGPLEVQIQMGAERTDVYFWAQHADTRTALQEALPRLRELFAAAGLQLGDAGVARDAPRQEAPSPGPQGPTGSVDDERIPASVARAVRAVASRRHAGLVDLYA